MCPEADKVLTENQLWDAALDDDSLRGLSLSESLAQTAGGACPVGDSRRLAPSRFLLHRLQHINSTAASCGGLGPSPGRYASRRQQSRLADA